MPPPQAAEPESDGPQATTSGRLPLLVAGIAAVVALAAVVLAGMTWNQARQLETQLAATQDQLADVTAEQRDLSSTVSAVAGDVGDLQAATGESLSSYLAGLDRAVAQAQSDAQDAQFTSRSLAARTDSFVDCVNTYMKTVADSGGGRYWFNFCQ